MPKPIAIVLERGMEPNESDGKIGLENFNRLVVSIFRETRFIPLVQPRFESHGIDDTTKHY